MSTSYDKQFNGRIDAYRICRLYDIDDPAIYHAIKKLLRSGDGEKPKEKDIDEAIMSLERWKEMEEEEKDLGKNQDVKEEMVEKLSNMTPKTFQPIVNAVEESEILPSIPNFIRQEESHIRNWIDDLNKSQQGELWYLIQYKEAYVSQ